MASFLRKVSETEIIYGYRIIMVFDIKNTSLSYYDTVTHNTGMGEGFGNALKQLGNILHSIIPTVMWATHFQEV